MAKDNQQITTDDMQQTIYKELGYKSYPFPFTTPAYLEAYGTLVGLNTPPAKTARVLELGATYGGNIISLLYLILRKLYTYKGRFWIMYSLRDDISTIGCA